MEDIWTHGSLLKHIQLSGIFEDDKHFVDLPVASKSSYETLTKLTQSISDQEIAEHPIPELLGLFHGEPSGQIEHVPEDFEPVPAGFLSHVTDREVREWALSVHGRWARLCRKAENEGARQSTLLPLSNYFFVPGQRFRELYYWDTYWVVKGLLVSNMLKSAKVVVLNLINLLQKHGFVPNGSRLYYLNRSQPPLLSHMIAAIYDAEGGTAWLQAALPALEIEHIYWTSAPKQLHVRAAWQEQGEVSHLSRYYADTETPRPEGYRMDVEAAAHLNDADARGKYREIASTAESGWDFSSRWGLRTTHIIPADLNCFLLMMERNMQRFAQRLGQDDKAQQYAAAADRRNTAIQRLMSAPGRPGVWTDLVIVSENGDSCADSEGVHEVHQRERAGSYASDYLLNWAGLAQQPDDALAGFQSMLAAGLVQDGGIATSDVEGTGNQWDGSNAWPPLQAMLIEGLHTYGGAQGQQYAETLAQLWLSSSYKGWLKYGKMFEKMDAKRPGEPGGEGEYKVQTGFGWSNGVVLQLLSQYGWHPELLQVQRPWQITEDQ